MTTVLLPRHGPPPARASPSSVTPPGAEGGTSREEEFKFRLPSEAALNAVAAAAGGPGTRTVQTNHVFDTADLDLFRSGFRLRLRQESGTWTLAAKGSKEPSEFKSLKRKVEVERPVSERLARELIAGRRSPLEALQSHGALNTADRAWVQALARRLGAKPVAHLGRFTNERTRIPARLPAQEGDVRVTLELDRTQLPGGRVDFEAEVELPPGAEPKRVEGALRGLFHRAGVKPESSSGKVKRFFEALDRVDLFS
ncbi:MAG TPA: CYTH domain-containing protein [Myxococcaceae bacterium]|nr:CYTH domain-containing protein [Myxococcaceae bacterium]